jgi:serine/threonine protein kinase
MVKMAARPVTHPSIDALKAFSQGKLAEGPAATLRAHLEACGDCRKAVTALSGDDNLARARQAPPPGGTLSLAQTVGEVPRAAKAADSPTILPTVPPELAGNPQYEILRELGRGGMGVVYLARNKMMDRLEVLKVVNKSLLDRPEAVERFLREIRSAAKLNHVNVVAAYSVLQLGNLVALAMEHVKGEDLASLVKARGPLPVAHACYYVQQAAFGLQHASEKGMVHRDIKPHNLMLAREGHKHVIKILDFGLAKATREKEQGTELTAEGAILGTPEYIAPEQTQNAAKADIRADIYSLGCTLYFLLTGSPPFKGGSLFEILLAHNTVEARPVNQVRAEVPPELAAVVARMMAKDPAKRYQTPMEVVQALTPFIKQGAKSAATSSPDRPGAPAAQGVKAKAPLVEAAVPAARDAPSEGGNPFSVLAESDTVHRPPLPLRKAASSRKWLLVGGVAAALLLLGLLGMLAGTVLKVKTKDGTIVLENLPADAEVLIDGDTVKLKDRNGEPFTVQIAAGRKHQLQVKKKGFKVFGEELAIDAGDHRTIRVRLEPEAGAGEGAVAEDGFVPLFNGKDLTGWKLFGGGTGNWRVENGAIVSRGPSSHLFTERGDYQNFHLRVEAQINDGGNSGVYFRSELGPGFPKGYEAQINCTHPDPVKTGSLYNIVKITQQLHQPNVWFTMEIIANGDRIIIKLNSRPIVDHHDPLYRKGHFALQQHHDGTVVKFRKIEIKELSPSSPAATAFASFFNGKDLAGWGGLPGYWHVENGALVARCPPNQHAHTFLVSKKTYRDFALKFQVRRKNGIGNSGVQFRSQLIDRNGFRVTGPQCEIDSATSDFPPGSLLTEPNRNPLDVKAPQSEIARAYKDADFNDYYIRCVGQHVIIEVNGVTAVKGIFSLPPEGVIAWQIHGSRPPQEVIFRNIEFTDLGP